jgi:hypothetical protein
MRSSYGQRAGRGNGADSSPDLRASFAAGLVDALAERVGAVADRAYSR